MTASPAAAGYSGTPLPRKLGIRAGARVVLSGAPPSAEALLGELPDGVRLSRRLTGAVDVIVLFAERRADLARRLPGAQAAMRADGGLWVAWPKRASGVPTDITEDVIREIGPRRRPGRQQGLRHRRDLVGAAAGGEGEGPPGPHGPPASGDAMSERYQRPGWVTTNVFNRIVAALTRAGISVWGSRVLEVRGRRSGEPRRNPVNPLTVNGVRYLVRPADTASGCATCAPPGRGGCSWVAGPSASPRPSSATTRSRRCCAPT